MNGTFSSFLRLMQDYEFCCGRKGRAQLYLAERTTQGDAHDLTIPVPIDGPTRKRQARYCHRFRKPSWDDPPTDHHRRFVRDIRQHVLLQQQ